MNVILLRNGLIRMKNGDTKTEKDINSHTERFNQNEK